MVVLWFTCQRKKEVLLLRCCDVFNAIIKICASALRTPPAGHSTAFFPQLWTVEAFDSSDRVDLLRAAA